MKERHPEVAAQRPSKDDTFYKEHPLSRGSESPHLPRAQRSETLGRKPRCVQSVRKCKARRVNRFIGKLESAVMMGERNFRSTVD
jgi:hypothetical protein